MRKTVHGGGTRSTGALKDRAEETNEVLRLQRLIGNRAVGALLGATPGPVAARPAGAPASLLGGGGPVTGPFAAGLTGKAVVQRAPLPGEEVQEELTDAYFKQQLEALWTEKNPAAAETSTGTGKGKGKAKAGGKGKTAGFAEFFSGLLTKTDAAFFPKKRSNPRRIEEVVGMGAGLLRQLNAPSPSGSGQAPRPLRVYRAMFPAEADACLNWAKKRTEIEAQVIGGGGAGAETLASLRGDHQEQFRLPVVGHAGDAWHARKYLTQENRMLEFVLKPKSRELMFSPEHLAIAPSGKRTPRYLRAMGDLRKSPYPSASKGEGVLGGYIGLKSEDTDFSLSFGGEKSDSGSEPGPSALLFQYFVEDIRDVTQEQTELKWPGMDRTATPAPSASGSAAAPAPAPQADGD